jgi:hypothetical protein
MGEVNRNWRETMGLPNVITDNPALIIGLIRSALLVVAAFLPNLFTPAQQEAIIALAVASLALTGLTVKTTVPKTPSADASPASIQAPPA